MKRFVALAFAGALALPAAAQAPEPVDTAAVRLIRQHGLDHSQVMETLTWITDVNGPRLTGSPALDAAERWAMTWLRQQGFQNVHQEPWGPFGRGWTLRKMSANAMGPSPFPLIAYPKAWSPSVRGTGDVVLFDAQTPEDLERFRGKLRGKVVLMEPMRAVSEPMAPIASRHNDASLLGLANYAADAQPTARPQGPNANQNFLQAQRMNLQRMQFVLSEGPLALFDRGTKGDYGTVFVSAVSVPIPEGATFESRPSGWNPRGQTILPQFTLAIEHYNRLARMVQRNVPVQVALDIETAYNDDDPMEHNVLAEIPGSDKADEVVMLGAHFDSWHAGTGATDNARGLGGHDGGDAHPQGDFAACGTQPRRTIRIGLWTGEEQGLLGSRAYVAEHFGTRGADGSFRRRPSRQRSRATSTSTTAPARSAASTSRATRRSRRSSARGCGRSPTSARARSRSGTRAAPTTSSFDAVGLPGFQFIQDPMAYDSRTHHSNMDVADHASEDDLKQIATVVASFVYHTAMRDELLPRKPMAMPTAARPAAAPRRRRRQLRPAPGLPPLIPRRCRVCPLRPCEGGENACVQQAFRGMTSGKWFLRPLRGASGTSRGAALSWGRAARRGDRPFSPACPWKPRCPCSTCATCSPNVSFAWPTRRSGSSRPPRRSRSSKPPRPMRRPCSSGSCRTRSPTRRSRTSTSTSRNACSTRSLRARTASANSSTNSRPTTARPSSKSCPARSRSAC